MIASAGEGSFPPRFVSGRDGRGNSNPTRLTFRRGPTCPGRARDQLWTFSHAPTPSRAALTTSNSDRRWANSAAFFTGRACFAALRFTQTQETWPFSSVPAISILPNDVCDIDPLQHLGQGKWLRAASVRRHAPFSVPNYRILQGVGSLASLVKPGASFGGCVTKLLAKRHERVTDSTSCPPSRIGGKSCSLSKS